MKATIHILCFFAVLFLSCTEKEEGNQRPNILFALADDASWQHFGAYGCDWVKTPAFDRVAKQGLLFTNAYTPNAKCAPSRSCILTGRNSWQLEAAANHAPFFPEKFKVYTEILKENGYWVGSTGKGWAPGNPGLKDGKRRELAGPKFNNYSCEAPTNAISDNDYAKNFEDFLNGRSKGQPFCFWYGAHEPHRAYSFKSGELKGNKSIYQIENVPKNWPDVDTVRSDMLDYAFEIEYFDQHLDRMLEILVKRGELDNTLVVVTSDNGMPFPRMKGQVYEYSNHLPIAVMWPKEIMSPGRVIDDYVSFIDFAPTFIEAASINEHANGMQPVTGKSLMEFFKIEEEGNIYPERNFVLVGKERHDVGRPDDQGYPVRGIVKNGYLYLKNYEPDRWPVGNPETGYLNCDGSPTKTYILNTRRIYNEMEFWQLNFGKREEEELYDIVKDPYCVNNLAGNPIYHELKGDMKKFMLTELRKQNDPRMLGQGEMFEKYPFANKTKQLYNRRKNGEEVHAKWVNDSDIDLDFVE